jgi:hypothetical protein
VQTVRCQSWPLILETQVRWQYSRNLRCVCSGAGELALNPTSHVALDFPIGRFIHKWRVMMVLTSQRLEGLRRYNSWYIVRLVQKKKKKTSNCQIKIATRNE